MIVIIKCVPSDEKTLLSYIGADYSSCLYLYLNLIKYGINSEVIGVYFQKENGIITSILLKYYSCLHVYSNDSRFDSAEVSDFFLNNNFTMLYCTAEIARSIYSEFPEHMKKRASITNGWVAQIKDLDKPAKGLAVKAQDKDFDQIVKLIYSDEDIGRSYKFDELKLQLVERNKDGYARNLVIKKGDLVISHACTNAELGNVAVVGELLVKEEYRKQGYASEIWRDICGNLLSEGKEVYSFYYSEESRVLHKHIGFFEVCEWAKVVVS